MVDGGGGLSLICGLRSFPGSFGCVVGGFEIGHQNVFHVDVAQLNISY